MNKVLIFLVFTSAIGCSNKGIYDNIIHNQRMKCLKEPPSTYAECMAQTNKPYEEYTRERKEINNNM